MPGSARARDPRPNIIWIMSDDLCWGDLGCYGQEKIRTPNIDGLAAAGIRFTDCYSGAPVCAPSRSSLMQGLHQGHATVRANMLCGYRHSLQAGDATVAGVLKAAGYATGMFGKWGLSVRDQPGLPRRKGFDEFYGYLNQRHAHNYYPTHLWHNEEQVPFRQHEGFRHTTPTDYDAQGRAILSAMADPGQARYSFDVYAGESLRFVREHRDGPFFLYLPYTIPHGSLVTPDLGPYAALDWPHPRHKEWAAMITRMDGEVGRLLALLRELGIAENTLTFFCSDNGYAGMGYVPKEARALGVPSFEEFFGNRGPFRGAKGDAHEGGLRVPMIAHWPAVIRGARVSDFAWAFWDFLPTAAELAGAAAPPTDGLSLAPLLRGDRARQSEHEFLYWEFLGRHGLEQAVRLGRFRAFRPKTEAPTKVYDLADDPAEKRDLAASHPGLVARAEELFVREHTPSLYFPTLGETVKQWQGRVKAQGVVLPRNVDLF